MNKYVRLRLLSVKFWCYSLIFPILGTIFTGSLNLSWEAQVPSDNRNGCTRNNRDPLLPVTPITIGCTKSSVGC